MPSKTVDVFLLSGNYTHAYGVWGGFAYICMNETGNKKPLLKQVPLSCSPAAHLGFCELQKSLAQLQLLSVCVGVADWTPEDGEDVMTCVAKR